VIGFSRRVTNGCVYYQPRVKSSHAYHALTSVSNEQKRPAKMDMDMDVAWCLTCSKRTVSSSGLSTVLAGGIKGDPRRPYCSNECWLQDAQETKLIPLRRGSIPLTSAVPPQLIASPAGDRKTLSPALHIKPPIKSTHRPPLAALPPSSASIDLIGQKVGTRDRRAFSFPAPRSPTPVLTKDRQMRQSSNVLPPFIRKPAHVAMSSMSSPFLPPVREHRRATGAVKPNRSTGANTPQHVEAVFCSTSESSGNEGAEALQLASAPPPSNVDRPSLLANQTMSFRSQLSMKHSSFLNSRKTSQGPVATLVASSASSRSREDIMSWARAVEGRMDQVLTITRGDEDKAPKRGRSRTRRDGALPRNGPLRAELAEDESHAAAGTTPKGRIGSALSVLSMGGFGVGPIVKALTSVSTPKSPEAKAVASGLPPVPASAEVSRIAVVTSTTTAEPETPGTYFNPGATPTLSTLSLSEAMEPSLATDNPEQMDPVADDQQSTSSYFALRQAHCSTKTRQHQTQVPQLPAPLRPIASTATAIWNMSTYLGSFSPFGLPSIVTPYAPTSSTKASTPGVRDSPAKTPEFPRTSPLPTANLDTPEDSASQQMVRSFPLDIIAPVGVNVKKDERVADWDVREIRDRSRSRSDSRAHRREISPSSLHDQPSKHKVQGHAHKWSYDADASDGEGEEPRRGRSRRGKALNRDTQRRGSDEAVAISASISSASDERRGRGRKRTARAL